MSEPEGRGADWTLLSPPNPPQERGTSDEGPPPQAARLARRPLNAPRRRAGHAECARTDAAGEPEPPAASRGVAAEISAVAEVEEADASGAPAGPGLAAERDRLARTLRETRLQLAMTQARLAALEQSATMELGRSLVRAARRPWSRGVQLPAELVRLWRERGGPAGPGPAPLALASAQLSDLAGGGERFLSALTAPGLGAPGSEAASWTPPGLVITGVLTASACATLAPDAAVHPLLPHDADVMLESAGADLVLIEAAALLAGSPWAYASDPAATDRGRRLGRLIAAARALGKPVIFIRNVPAHLAPGLDWVAACCDAISDEGLGVQLARFNPIGLAGSRPGEPVYADARDPREPPAVRALLDEAAPGRGAASGRGAAPGREAASGHGAASVRVAGSVPWRGRPALYREHALFVTVSADQVAEQLACGARVIMIGGEQAAGAGMPAGEPWSAPGLREKITELQACAPLSGAQVRPALREIFAGQATPVRLAALARLAGLGDHMIAGRRIAVLARVADAAAAAALSAALTRQRLAPAEVVVVAEAPDAASAEVSARAVTAVLGELADRGITARAVPVVTGGPDTAGVPVPAGAAGWADLPEPAGWLRRAAGAARSPWVVPWHAGREYPDCYLPDLACARECSQADAAGYAGTTYAFTASLEPALARRDFFASGDPGHGLRLFSVS